MALDRREQAKQQAKINQLTEDNLLIRKRLQELESDSVGLADSLLDSLKEIQGIQIKRSTFDSNLLKVNQNINKEIQAQRGGLNDIKSLDKQIEKNKKLLIKAAETQKDLANGLGKAELERVAKANKIADALQNAKDEQQAILETSNKTGVLDKKALAEAKRKQKIAEGLLETSQETLTDAGKQIVFTKQNAQQLERQNKARLEEKRLLKEAEKSIGVFGGVLKGISKIPLLGDLVDADEAFEAATEAAAEVPEGGNKGLAGMAAGAKVLGKQLVESFKPANIAAGIFTAILKTITMLDKTSGEVAKSMNMTVGEARDLQRSFASLSSGELKDSLVSSQGLLESLQAINKTLGTNVMLNQEDLVTFTKLREAAGFTNEELMGIQQLTLANGESLKQNTGEFLAQAKVSAMQNGVLLNEKELLKGISEVSAATTLSFGKNPALIADAVAQAKSLGMELDQVDAIAESLLNFEQSIANELEAELLLGQSINLEKARQAALDNDLATLAKEISTQVGSAAEFGEMNRIQQDALAQSVGMTREDLAQTLFVQEQLAGATGEEAEKRQAILDKRIEEVGLAQAQKEIAKDGLSTLEDQASVSEKFEKTIKKLLDTFMGIAGVVLEIVDPILNILLPVFNTIAGAVKLVFEGFVLLKPVIIGIGVALTAMLAPLLATAVYEIFIGAFKSLKNPLVAIPVALAGVALLKRMATADDLISAPTKKPGYGDRTLFGPEGAIALNNKDTIIAGTNLFPRGNDVVSTPAGTMSVNSNAKTDMLLETLVRQNARKPQISPVGLYEVQ